MSCRVAFAGFVLSALAAAQTLSFGVVGGASVTPDFENRFFAGGPPGGPIVLTDSSAPERYIAGGMLEYKLSSDWSIEGDALYHPLRFDEYHYANGTLHNIQPLPVVTWEFPALAKYRFRWGSWRPFLDAGPTFRTAGNLNGTTPSHYGIAAGVGAETRLGGLRVAPQVRYIHWAPDNPVGQPTTHSDQLELLTSLSTGSFEGGHVFGRRVSVGLALGVTLSPDFRAIQGSSSTFTSPNLNITETYSYSSGARSFLIGPMVEVKIVRGLGVEVDAIHRPMRFHSQFEITRGPSFSGGFAPKTWEYPVLGKYKFSGRAWIPFVEAGPSFRLANAVEADTGSGVSPYGVTAGAGIETHLRRLKIAPAVRYTHWGANSPETETALQSYRSQLELLGGFSF